MVLGVVGVRALGAVEMECFRVFFALLSCRVRVGVFDAGGSAVHDCILGVHEVEDEGRCCG